MPRVSYVVDLSDKERMKLLSIINRGKSTYETNPSREYPSGC